MANNYSEQAFEKVKKKVKFYEAPWGERHISIDNGRYEGMVSLKSEPSKMFLQRIFKEITGRLPKVSEMRELEGLLAFEAYENSKVIKPATRVRHEKKKVGKKTQRRVFLDLGNGYYVIITKKNHEIKRITHKCFLRGRCYEKLPTPDFSDPKAALEIFKLINVSKEDFPLCVAWVMAFFLPTGTLPILNMHGEFGSAKTTTLSILKSVIDPSDPLRHQMPAKEKELLVATKPFFSVVFDNVSSIPDSASNGLCKMVDYASFLTREFYTTSDIAAIKSRAIPAINGIGNSVIQGDLLSRTLDIEPPHLANKKSSEVIWRKFKKLHPKMLGSVILAVQHGLKNLDANQSVPEEFGRLADFYIWTKAWETFFFEKEEVLNLLAKNKLRNQHAPLEVDIVSTYLIDFAKKCEYWEGDSTKLLEELNSIATIEDKKSKGWPKNASYMGRLLERLKPALREVGVTVERNSRGKSRNNIITYEDPEDRDEDYSLEG